MDIEKDYRRLEQINDPASFEHAVLHDPANRNWIRSIRGERLAAIAQQKLQSLAVELNARWQLEQAEREAAEKARQSELDKEKAELQLALNTHRTRQLQIAAEQPATEQDNTAQGRAELIAETMLKAIQAWGGRAVECTACHLLSPPESQFCLYCDESTSTVNPVTLSPDVPLTIHKRMRCSAKPTMSMKSVPRLLLRPELKASADVLITPVLQKEAMQ